MNLEERLKPIVEKAIEGIEKTGEFAIEQAPIVLQEFYNWHIANNLMWTLFWAGMFFVPLLIRKVIPKTDDKDYYGYFLGKRVNDDDGATAWLISIALWLFSLIIFIEMFLDLVKVMVAPRIYLIEYFLQ